MRDTGSCGLESPRCEGDRGGNLVEYALLLCLILLACLGAVSFFGRSATGKVDCVSSAITQQVGGVSC